MSILGIGTDIVNKQRINDILGKHGERFIQRVLTFEELDYFDALKHDAGRVDYLAKRYAAKEAIAKAFGTGIGEKFSFQDATIFNQRSGKPDVALSAKGDALLRSMTQQRGGSIHLSLADEVEQAVAFVIIEPFSC